MSMDWTARELVEALRAKPKPQAYDTQATVMRVDGDTLWCHFPGGVDETPVQRTIDAREGDTIQVRISGGNATATGNATAPPTDDKRANEAAQMAEDTAKTMAEVVETVQEAGASLVVMGDQIRSVVTELGEKNRTFSAGAGTAYVQLCTKSGDPICTKAGDPILAAVRIPSGTALDDYTVGDLWYDTDEDNAVYRWNGNYWEPVADQRISEISQKLDSITLRVVGADGAVSEIGLTDQGYINLLGTVLAQRIAADELMARNLTATGTFQVNNGVYYLTQTANGLSFGSLLEDDDPTVASTEIRANASSGITLKTESTNILLNSSGGGGITLSTDNLGAVSINGGLMVYRGGAAFANGGPLVGIRTKTVTGTTSTSGNVSLGLTDDYGVLCVRRILQHKLGSVVLPSLRNDQRGGGGHIHQRDAGGRLLRTEHRRAELKRRN